MTPLLQLLLRILTLATFVSVAGGSRSSPPPGGTGDERVSPREATNAVVLRLPAGEIPRAEAPALRTAPDLPGVSPSPAPSCIDSYGAEPVAEWSSGYRAIGYLRRIPRMGSDEPPRLG